MLSNYIKTFMNQMSRRTGVTLTEAHRKILTFAHTHYETHGVPPLYTAIQKATGTDRPTLERLFPHGIASVYAWCGIPVKQGEDGCKPVAEVTGEQGRALFLDHNATTPPRAEIRDLMARYYSGEMGFGNPSSSSPEGKAAFDLVMNARKDIAGLIDAQPHNIIFTGSGSEANNLAIKGIACRYMDSPAKGHIITTEIEHPSVIESVHFLGMLGFDISFIPPKKDGTIDPSAIMEALRSDTILVCAMAANNEIGTITPIRKIGALLKMAEVPFMVDAVQAFGRLPLSPKEMGVTLMSFSGHKIYGPKGIGALYVDDSVDLVPVIHGGGQELGRRAGTENVGHIIALAKAAQLAHHEMDEEWDRLTRLNAYFLDRLHASVTGCVVNGSLTARIPHNLSIGFPGVDAGALLLSLANAGIAVSSGSACHSGSREVSHVLHAIQADSTRYGTLRFGLGRSTTREDIDYLFSLLPEMVRQLQG